MTVGRMLEPGTRVRLTAIDRTLSLRSDTGAILGPSEWDGYYVVRLDLPAVLDERTGETEDITDVVQDEEELEVIE